MDTFTCYACNKKYEDEKTAVDCCSQPQEFNDGDFCLPAKSSSRRPISRSHNCPNVNFGGKTWSVFLSPDEKCPTCDHVWRPR